MGWFIQSLGIPCSSLDRVRTTWPVRFNRLQLGKAPRLTRCSSVVLAKPWWHTAFSPSKVAHLQSKIGENLPFIDNSWSCSFDFSHKTSLCCKGNCPLPVVKPGGHYPRGHLQQGYGHKCRRCVRTSREDWLYHHGQGLWRREDGVSILLFHDVFVDDDHDDDDDGGDDSI